MPISDKRRLNNLLYGYESRLKKMQSYGESKHKYKEIMREQYQREHNNLIGWNPTKCDDKIFSKKTYEDYLGASRDFAKWVFKNHPEITNVTQITREIGIEYLKDRDNGTHWQTETGRTTPFTVSRDMALLNKVHHWGFTKKQLGLRERKTDDIVRSRKSVKKDKYVKWEENKDQITIALGVGCRRESLDQTIKDSDPIRPSRCVWSEDGERITKIYLHEKGGKWRLAPVLDGYQKQIGDIVKEKMKEFNGKDKILFEKYDRNVDNHSLRRMYAQNLLSEVEKKFRNGERDFFNDSKYTERLSELHGKDAERKRQTYKNHPLVCCAVVTNALGHSRLQVLNHYIDF